MKITRDRALEVTAYCRKHKLSYANASTFPGTRAAALRKNERSPGGMLVHFPRNSRNQLGIEWLNPRAYVLWFGEPIGAIEEACAFILMTQKQRTDITVLRCKPASESATLAEQRELEDIIHPAVFDDIDSVE